ncbi:MAG: Anhydro-N-acetylmuramic acid kinase [Bacteroidota bacterium]|jgi:anhydro-N-acetylmuramic acid kinase
MQTPQIYHVIGLMSGSSLDGLDIAYCTFQKQNNKWSFSLLKAETIEYSSLWQSRLTQVTNSSALQFIETEIELTEFWAENILHFITSNQIKNIDFIASHGHTIFHQPNKKYSTQIVNGAALAALTKLPVVCDFRSTDVALNGQGAPLVPLADFILFDEFAACLNLGGISNISLTFENKKTAFDISACNQWLNHIAQLQGKPFDSNGEIAQQGNCNIELMKLLNSFYFYQLQAPKSLSNKDCEDFYQKNILPFAINNEDKMRTIVEHIAHQINACLPNNITNRKCLVTGGGAYNTCLINELKKNEKWNFIIPTNEIISFKEAIIFAFLGVLRWRNEINVLAEITGATKDSCSGAIYLY